MFTVHVEPFSIALAELKSLIDGHYSEISEHRKHGVPLDPDYDEYDRLERNGKLVFLALRCKGKMIGYATGIIARALHYRTILEWHPDLFFVKVEFRGNRTGQNGGILLRNAIKKEAQRRGVRMIKQGCKVSHRKHMEKLFLNDGFEPYEISYALWL